MNSAFNTKYSILDIDKKFNEKFKKNFQLEVIFEEGLTKALHTLFINGTPGTPLEGACRRPHNCCEIRVL